MRTAGPAATRYLCRTLSQGLLEVTHWSREFNVSAWLTALRRIFSQRSPSLVGAYPMHVVFVLDGTRSEGHMPEPLLLVIDDELQIRRKSRRFTPGCRCGRLNLASRSALVLDFPARVLTRDCEQAHLTPIEWDLLRILMVQAGRALTQQYLFTRVWSGRHFGEAQQSSRVHRTHLRRKIEADSIRPRYILTEPGVGYRFATAAEAGASK